MMMSSKEQTGRGNVSMSRYDPDTIHAVNKVMQAFARAGLVKELTGQKRNRLYSYDRCLSILSEGTEPLTNFS